MAWRDARQSIAGRMGARASVGRDEIRATPRDVFRMPCDDDRWDSVETSEGPTRRRSANRACQLASSWSRNDHEDGGPTIQLPAAEARCTLRSLSCVQYTRLGPFARTVALQRGSPDLSVVGPGAFRCAPKPLQSTSRGRYRPNHYSKLSALENLSCSPGLHGGQTEPPETRLRHLGLQEDGDGLVAEYSKEMCCRLTLARAITSSRAALPRRADRCP